MADRSRRTRKIITDVVDDSSEPSASESELDWDPRRADSARRAGRNELPAQAGPRSRRTVDDKTQSIRLTMKVAPSKLREVTRANEVDSLQDTLGGGKVIDGPRSRRSVTANARASARGAARPRYVEYAESELEEDDEEEREAEEPEPEDEEEEEDDEEDEDGDEEEEDDEDEEEAEEDDEEDEEEPANGLDEPEVEAEEASDDEDVEMEDAPPVPPPSRRPHAQPKPPKITLKPPPKSESKRGAKTKVIVTPAQVGPLKSVEDQEMEDDPGDEEVDEASSELSEDEDVTNLNEEVEGEEEPLEEDMEGEDEEMDDDEELDDSGDETPASGMNTPDPNRLTKRQRGRPEDQTQLMALDMAPQQRKFFTDEEKAMKKDEHARKRKELTKRKILEEKTAALNRLLKPQASKARGAAPKPETLAAAAAAAATEEEEPVEKANPLYTRWISTVDGIRLGVPEEWLGQKVGRGFGPPLNSSNGALVQEVE